MRNLVYTDTRLIISKEEESVKKLYLLLSCLILLLVLVLPIMACSTSTTSSPSTSPATSSSTKPVETIVLSATAHHNIKEPRTVLFVDFLELINKNSNGQLKIEFKGGPEVIPANEQGKAIASGVVDMASLAAGAFETLVPCGAMNNVSRVSHKEEMNGGAYDIWKQAYAEAGIYYIGRTDPKNTPHYLWGFNKKIQKFDELSQIKLCCTTTWAKAAAEACGMSYNICPMADVYTALDTGVYDGFGTNPPVWVANSLPEVCDYMLDAGFYYTNMVSIMCLDTYQNLPDHLQKVIDDTYLEFEPEMAKRCQQIQDEALNKLRESMEFISFSKEDKEKFLDIVYAAQAKRLVEEVAPKYGPKLLKPLGVKLN